MAPKAQRGRTRTEHARNYIRDGRAPVPAKAATSVVMSANRGRNTGPEVALRKALWQEGVRGYRLHLKGVPGRPDIAFKGLRLAVFVHGCYWHRCPSCALKMPSSNEEFWARKFRRNVERDQEKERELAEAGWVHFTVWECEIRKGLSGVVDRIRSLVHERREEADKGR